MDIQIFGPENKITIKELEKLAENWFGDMVKAVADTDRQTIAVGGEWHADAESLLLAQGSKQENLWGFNLYPFEPGDNFLVFDSLINIRPRQNNRSMSILDESVRNKILELVKKSFSGNGY